MQGELLLILKILNDVEGPNSDKIANCLSEVFTLNFDKLLDENLCQHMGFDDITKKLRKDLDYKMLFLINFIKSTPLEHLETMCPDKKIFRQIKIFKRNKSMLNNINPEIIN